MTISPIFIAAMIIILVVFTLALFWAQDEMQNGGPK